ncbi:BON domain-containing protein [Pacificoceanicola onchidii]|uniref:BON domain-containing protein n=1 Tax=Pacificoceanicola onchidii TaxID=2562685 RepID=UPI0010A62E3C|nr:BON domain-containing protein [Pacificoceanicola onchidii]
MRDFLAIVVIVLVVIGLGVFRVPNEDALVAAGIRAEAQGVLYQAKHPLSVAVERRAVTVSGRVESEAEAASVVASLRALQGVESVVSKLEILPAVDRFVLTMRREVSTGEIEAEGFVPNAQTRDAIGGTLGIEASQLTVATGVPDGNWSDVATRLAVALAGLDVSGVARLDGQTAVLSGTTTFPAQADAVRFKLGDIPEGYALETDIKALDDGLPYSFIFSRDPVMGVRFEAKTPPGFDWSAMPDLQEVFSRRSYEAAGNMDDGAFAQALTAVLPRIPALQSGAITVTPGLVTFNGVPVSDEQAGQIEALQDALPERWTMLAQLVPSDTGAPFWFEADWDGEILRTNGDVPAFFWGWFDVHEPDAAHPDPGETIAAKINRPVSVLDSTEIGSIPDMNDWADPVWTGLKALVTLREGQMRYDAEGVRLSGVAANPAARQAMRDALGDAGAADVLLADDGAPVAFTVSYDAATGAAITGKLPMDLNAQILAEALGLESMRGTPTVGPYGSGVEALNRLRALANVLPVIETATLEFAEGDLTLSATVTQGVTPEDVPLDAKVEQAAEPRLGTQRTHVLTGEAQVFTDGFWLPVVRPEVSASTCEKGMTSLPEVPFQEGSFALRYDAALALAPVAAFARACTWTGDLALTIDVQSIGTGFEALDKQRARRRAEAIRQALIKRGGDASRVAANGEAGPDSIGYRWE